jgi:hypothetical protein
MKSTKTLVIVVLLFIFANFASGSKVCIDNSVPTIPGNLEISDSPYDTDGNVQLTWSASTDDTECGGVDHYNIYRSTDNNAFNLIAKTSDLIYDNNGLAEGNTYYYKVTAVDKVVIQPHESDFSNTVSTTIRAEEEEEEEKKTTTGGSSRSSSGGPSYTTSDDGTMKDTLTACVVNWSCSEWSDCDDSGVKTRTCVDLNECNDVLNKPEEMDYCVQTKDEKEKVELKNDDQLDFDFDDEESVEPKVIEDEPKKSGLSKITGAVIGGGVTSFMSLIALFLILGAILFVHRKRMILGKAVTKKKK